MRCIVNVATGPRYVDMQKRLIANFGKEMAITWTDSLPYGCTTHELTPYAFKAHAVKYAITQGFDTVIWMDSSVVPVRPLDPLWELIESRGYWISNNPPFNCGQFTADSALGPLGITREEAFAIPHVIGTAFGLDFRHDIAHRFFNELLWLADDGRAFRGPWTNHNGEASADPRVRGHRHDQTAMSVIAHRLGMQLTEPPKWIVDDAPATEETALIICR